jgi:parallel beta-helix repeat protein
VFGTPGNWINGTPKQANSAATSPTTIEANIGLRFDEFSTMTLTALGSPYITTGITVPASKTLVVEPGVQVKFRYNNGGRLIVQGTFKAQGTQANQITLTAFDGDAVWCGVSFASTSTASQLDYVVVDKANSVAPSSCNASFSYAVYVDSSTVAINNSIIQTGSYHRKLYLKNSNSTVSATTVSNATLNADSVGIYIDGGSPTISNSTISTNSIGIFINSLSNNPTIQNNTFTGNTYAVKTDSAVAAFSGNAATGNTYNGVFVEGITQANTTWQKDAIPYIVNKFTAGAGTTLTIQAGVVVKFIYLGYTNPEIVVDGTLVTQGTAANPVIFTTTSDDTVGGSNTYGGTGSLPSWKRIYIAPGSTGSQLAYTTLKYGGNTYYEAALYVKQSSVQVANLTISNSIQSAIFSDSGTITGSGVTLSNNQYGFHMQGGNCPVFTDTPTITGGAAFHSSSFPSCTF